MTEDAITPQYTSFGSHHGVTYGVGRFDAGWLFCIGSVWFADAFYLAKQAAIDAAIETIDNHTTI